MTSETTLLPNAKVIGVVPAGTRIAQLFDGRIVAVHPDHPPWLVTADGLVPFDVTHVQLALDFTMSVSVGSLR